MVWNEDMVDGFVLAAAANGDLGKGSSLDGLGQAARHAVEPTLTNLRGLEREDRAEPIKSIAARLQKAPTKGVDAPPSVRRFLRLPQSDSASPLREREGYVASPALRACVLNLLPRAAPLAAAEAKEEAEGVRILANLDPSGPQDLAKTVLSSLDSATSRAVAAARRSTPVSPSADEALELVEIAWCRRQTEPMWIRLLGALSLGRRGALTGDAWSNHWRRVGFEISGLGFRWRE